MKVYTVVYAFEYYDGLFRSGETIVIAGFDIVAIGDAYQHMQYSAGFLDAIHSNCDEMDEVIK